MDTDLVDVPTDWLERAALLKLEITEKYKLEDKEPFKKTMAKAAKLWSELKMPLAFASHGKCWYCECRQIRSDLQVDHFRPKGRVAEDAAHSGYWWLALEPDNFRLACQYCNQYRRGVKTSKGGGKADRFPLRDGSARATNASDAISAESATLLDPTSAQDVHLLTFGLDGRPSSNTLWCTPDSWAESRATSSIEIYHLDHPGIVDQRKKLNRTLGRTFDDTLSALIGGGGDAQARAILKRNFDALARAIRPQSEHSSAARAYLRSRRADSPAAEQLVETILG
ncbi:HNH endonuclease signature motif containing protein [Frigoribacterium sp. Leaf164]|uniref:HNH endonuclease signature motif containing protein n=1 Tax=Frigoribacterium sp. Leaf164 TaxID=1736282 RepID=UPI0012E2D105|nr:HNH endonuclease signature motif containing protein [Frigoribacterium sp. Leaf164]